MHKTKLKFQTELRSVYSLFKGACFVIPAYQRQYSWDTEQWEALWQDLEQYKQENSDEHFLGPVIVTASETTGSQFEVIDGQQRLTTLQVIISLIRDSWIERGDERTSDSGIAVPNRAVSEELIHSLTPTVRYNFVPNRHLKEIFRQFIQIAVDQESRLSFDDIMQFQSAKHADQANELRRAWQFFKSKIDNLSNVELKKFESYLLFKVLVLTIEAGESSNAYILFETLNYRGLELTQSDLVKSYLFSKVFSEEEDERYIAIWDEIETLLGNQSPDVFLRHFLLLSTEKVLKKDIYGEIRSRYQTKQEVVNFISELQKYAQLYSYLVRETDFRGHHKEVLNPLLSDLAKVGVDTQYVYLLSILSKFFVSEDDLDNLKIEAAARLSEVLSFRWTVCGRNAQDLERIYQRAASELWANTNLNDAFSNAQRMILESLPSDGEFFRSLSNKVIKSNQRGHYILRKIDQWQNKDGAYVLMGPSELQLEHVAPRKPTTASGWKNTLGEVGYSDLVGRIGNMILLKKKPNRDGSNKSFRDKLKIYAALNKGKYPKLSREVFDMKVWNKEIIEQRSEEIARIATEVWSMRVSNTLGRGKKKVSKKRNKRKVQKKKTKVKTSKKVRAAK